MAKVKTATANSDADAGPYTVGVGRPLMIDFSGVAVRDRDGNSVGGLRVDGGFKADPRYPQTLGWRTTP